MTDLLANTASPFAYSSLDAETRIVVQQRTGEIKLLMKRAAQDIIEIGRKLSEVKMQLGHGHFGAWIQTEFSWSESTATKMMQVAEAFKSVNFMNMGFAPSALYLLAAPSTPEAAREEAVKRAEHGERITHQTAQMIVQQHRPLPSATVPGLPPLAHPIDDDLLDFGGAEDPYGGVQVQQKSSPYQEPRRKSSLVQADSLRERVTPTRAPQRSAQLTQSSDANSDGDEETYGEITVRFASGDGQRELTLGRLHTLPVPVAKRLCDALVQAGWLDG